MQLTTDTLAERDVHVSDSGDVTVRWRRGDDLLFSDGVGLPPLWQAQFAALSRQHGWVGICDLN